MSENFALKTGLLIHIYIIHADLPGILGRTLTYFSTLLQLRVNKVKKKLKKK